MSTLVRNTDPVTSRRAARSASSRAAKHREVALDLYRNHEHAYYGLTAPEVRALALDIGLDPSTSESVRRRVADLVHDGVLVKRGERRRNAEVFVLDRKLCIRKKVRRRP